MGFSD